MRSLALSIGIAVAPLPAQTFHNFESPLAHGLALSPGGDRLFAVNAAAARLAVFSLADPRHPRLEREIDVALEPVAVAAHGDAEVAVVCWLSDCVQLVSLPHGNVVATIAVGDEPGDIVFAGEPARAFVSVSGPREVTVIDPASRVVVARVPVFCDAPRALCRSIAGDRVYVAAQRSGNGTTIAPAGTAPLPPTPDDDTLPSAPREGLIVRADDPAWRQLDVALPDLDVFGLDAQTFAVVEQHAHVGTSLFDLASDPRSGDLWVANTEAHNLVRFEPALRGHPVDHRLTRIARAANRPADTELTVFDLNPERERALALAQPTAVCFAPDGARLFVAAFASDRIAVLDRDGAVTARLELAPDPAHRDPRAMRGPRALAHHPSAPVLYVLNRLAGTVAAIDTATLAVASEVSIGADPTPRWLAEGRGFVQSAWLSGTGLAACGSCHLDGDWDGLAWDLGDPHGAMATVPNKSLYPLRMHPMKGPMKTQSLRGLTPDAGPFHHRGDRPSLRDFNASFDTLLGGTPLAEPDLTTAVRYLQSLRYPPNPHRALEDHEDERGGALFVQPFQGAASCKTCHFGAAGTSGLIMSGHLLQYQPQPMKVGQLRDAYKRTARIAENGRRRGGFGLLHDGSIDRVASFLARPFFRGFAHSPEARAGLERTVLAFDTGTPPAVGWAMTVASPDDARLAELEIVEQLARSGRCELVAFGRTGGAARRWTFDAETARYRGDGRDAMRSELLAELDPADGDAITFLGRPSF